VAPGRTVAARLEADDTVSLPTNALPQSLQSADVNNDRFVDWPEAYAALQQQKEALPKGFWKALWYGPGAERAFHVAHDAYFALVADARNVLAAESRTTKELAHDVNIAASKVRYASELVAARPGGADEISTVFEEFHSSGSYTVTSRPYNNVGLASEGPGSETYTQVKTALDEAAALLAQVGQIAYKNELQGLTEKLKAAAKQTRSAGGGQGEVHASLTERGMSKNQALAFLTQADQIVKGARKALRPADSK
jgi:hypothetical protein